MNKAELLTEIRAERKALEEMLAGLSDAQMIQTGPEAAWSVKDTLAHIVAWEQWMIGWTDQLLRGELPHDPTPVETEDDVDRLNAASYERNRDRVSVEVQADFQRSYLEALHLAEGLPEEKLQEEHPNTWPHGPLWQGVAANTCWHYREHLETIQARMGRGGADVAPS